MNEKKKKRDFEIQEIFGAFRMIAVELINRVQQYRHPVSNNNIDFFPYDTPVVDALIGQAFDDTHLDWLYVRINYDAQLNTIGTVEFPLILK